jgi:hypothetical protein
MNRSRLASVSVAAAFTALGAAPLAWAPHPITVAPATGPGELVLHLRLGDVRTTGSVSGELGSRFAITATLSNRGRQFGKPDGARVGRMLIDCTVLSDLPDGLCSGIAHLPDGYFTFSGSGPFSRAKVKRWAITGGVGTYNGWGQMFVRTGSAGSVAAVHSDAP